MRNVNHEDNNDADENCKYNNEDQDKHSGHEEIGQDWGDDEDRTEYFRSFLNLHSEGTTPMDSVENRFALFMREHIRIVALL